MVTFAWAERSVEQKIARLRNPEDRRQALTALRWLLRHSGDEDHQSAYAEFFAEHRDFLRRNPRATEIQRRRWLHFLEREGLECALRPDLFFLTARHSDLGTCAFNSLGKFVSTVPRSTSASFTTKHEDGDYNQGVDWEFNSTKWAFATLVLSPMVDHAVCYELLHFARGHSFSEEYWKEHAPCSC